MTRELKILMLEDMAYDAELVQHELKRAEMSFTSKVVGNKEDFISALNDFKPDIILSDHTLPQFSSSDALQIYKDHNLDIPFILVTGTVSEEFAVSSIHHGADDYILKGNLTRLSSAIENALKKRKAERQKEIALETLKTQNIDLSRINKELDHLVYSASHDLRSPLTSILGLLYLLKAEKDETKVLYYHELIEKSVKKLDSIIKDIITYSRNTRQEIKIEKVDIKELVKVIFKNLESLHPGIDIETKIMATGEVLLYSDGLRLKVVFNNLVSNAIIYRNEIDPLIEINVNVTSQEATVIIKDNGPGIPQKHIENIFDMFYRGSDKSTGSGMGLYIVKEYLRKLNGTISVTSKEGEGTTFTVQIPNNYIKS